MAFRLEIRLLGFYIPISPCSFMPDPQNLLPLNPAGLWPKSRSSPFYDERSEQRHNPRDRLGHDVRLQDMGGVLEPFGSLLIIPPQLARHGNRHAVLKYLQVPYQTSPVYPTASHQAIESA